MRSSITSSLRIKEMGKTCFPLGKTEFLIHWEFCVYHKIFGQGYLCELFDVFPKQTTCEMKALKYTNLHSAMIL